MRTRGLDLLTVASGLMALSTWACADQLDITLASSHSTAGYWSQDGKTYREYNEVNLGVIYTWDNGVVAGLVHNSYDELALMTGYTLQSDLGCCLNFGITAGIATGYEQLTGHEVSPMVMPFMTFGPDVFRFKVGLTPGTTGATTVFMLNTVF